MANPEVHEQASGEARAQARKARLREERVVAAEVPRVNKLIGSPR